MPRVLFVARQFSDAPRDAQHGHPGGAELTDEAVIRACPWPVDRVAGKELDPKILDAYDIHVLGNLRPLSAAQQRSLMRLQRHVMFEHDLRICLLSGYYGKSVEPVHRFAERCICPHRRLRGLFRTALGCIFLTQAQLNRYLANPWFRCNHPRVLGSSAFPPAFFEGVERQRALAAPAPRTLEACVVYSKKTRKGFKESLQWCQQRGIDPFIIRDLAPEQVLETLGKAKKLVFLPEGHEAASRLAVEARLMGCEVITDSTKVGVMHEPWWEADDDRALAYLKAAPARFWSIVADLWAHRPHSLHSS